MIELDQEQSGLRCERQRLYHFQPAARTGKPLPLEITVPISAGHEADRKQREYSTGTHHLLRHAWLGFETDRRLWSAQRALRRFSRLAARVARQQERESDKKRWKSHAHSRDWLPSSTIRRPKLSPTTTSSARPTNRSSR